MKAWKELSTTDKIAEIRAVYLGTVGSATTIARALSTKFSETITRNAVIGFYNRQPASFKDMPLTGVGGCFVEKRKLSPIGPPKVKPLVGQAQFARKKPDPVKVAEVKSIELRPAPIDMPKPLRTALLDLARTDCRWPVEGEKSKTLFCGHPAHSESSYCPGHHRLSIGHGTRSERLAIPSKLMVA